MENFGEKYYVDVIIFSSVEGLKRFKIENQSTVENLRKKASLLLRWENVLEKCCHKQKN